MLVAAAAAVVAAAEHIDPWGVMGQIHSPVPAAVIVVVVDSTPFDPTDTSDIAEDPCRLVATPLCHVTFDN